MYLGEEPAKDQLENVSINVIANPGGYVQSATLNVNIHVMGLDDHQPNHARMKQLLDLVLPALDDATHTIGSTTIHVDVLDDKGVFKDQENHGKFFYNIRVNCITL